MKDNVNQIYVIEIVKRIIKRKWLFLTVTIITFALSCAIILPVPRYYTSSVELAPEMTNLENSAGGLSSLASSLGFNVGNGLTTDAIYPELYPELIKSNDFLINLMNCRVKTQDGTVDTTYYKYLKSHQKKNPLLAPFGAIKKIFKKKQASHTNAKLNIFNLSKEDDGIFGKARNNITCSIDKKTGMIQVSVEDQDPLICAMMADTVMSKLQEFIIRYRTSKAYNDVIYYKKLTAQTKQAYEKARQLYGSYSDANTDVLLQSIKSKQEDLENDMQLKYNAYTAMTTQLQSAEAKLLERTPAFTVVKSASVPIKPAGPKRMAFVLVMLILSWAGTTIYICRDLYANLFNTNK